MLTQTKTRHSVIRVATAGHAHPFLIVSKQDYTELQARAASSPWKEQKEAVLSLAATLVCKPADGIRAWSETLARILSTTALAYILDPQNRPAYRDRIVEHLRYFDEAHPQSMIARMRANPDKMLWIYGVPTGNAFFQGVLALDIIHDDLPEDLLQQIEAFLRRGPADYFMKTPLAWRQGYLAAKAIWPLYERNAAVYQPIVEQWYEDVMSHISEDGVFTGGTAYAIARWSHADREHKGLFGEVLAHAGVLRSWYEEPRLRNFQEWLYGYAYTPFRICWTFGDSGPGGFNAQLQPGPERGYRYSELAGQYAAWLSQGTMPYVGLGSYVLSDQPYPAAAATPSRVFADGGAWLKQTSLDPRSLSAVLWNLKGTNDVHAHKETNSLGLAAYGEMLLRASGYNGWADGESGFSWAYINDRAIAANTVLFDYSIPTEQAQEQTPSTVNDHVKKYGAGIRSSLLSGSVDFAQGDSGDAIGNGRHLRNFLFIHPADGAEGYWVVIDELIPAAAGSTGHIVWHPSSSSYSQTGESLEYTWSVREFSDSDVSLTIFLGTEPARCAVRNGVLANWGKGLVGKYLACDYAAGEHGSLQVLTVLFPHDAAHPRAEFSRVKLDTSSGTIVRQGEIKDFWFESSGKKPEPVAPGAVAKARAGFIRLKQDFRVLSSWLLDAEMLICDGFKFESTAPVVLFRRGNQLRIATKVDCGIEIEERGLVGVAVDDGEIIRGPVLLKAGNHLLTLHLEP
jgi:hypothetical protein